MELMVALELQAGEQPRIPPLRTVIADGYAKRLLLPDQHEQSLAPCDPRVDQVPLQQHVVLRGERYHHRRKLRPLRLVDGNRVTQRDFIQFPEVVLHKPIIKADRNLMLDWVDAFNGSDVAVEDLLVIVVLRLDDLVANLESPSEPLDGGLAGSGWVQYLL